MVYFYAPGRAGENAETFLTGFDGILQVDGYTGYNRLTNLYPRLVDVTGRCPPEDVGGLPGYEHFLSVIGDPDSPEHEELTEWAGGSFNPYVPDAEELRLDVLKLAKKWKPRKK